MTPEEESRAVEEADRAELNRRMRSMSDTPKRGRKSEKRQRSAMVSVRMTQDELGRVQAEAQAVGQTVSTYMRDVALSCSRRLGGAHLDEDTAAGTATRPE